MNILLTGHYKTLFKNGFCFSTRHGQLHENLFVKFITLKNEFYKLGVNLVASDRIPINHKFSALIVHDHPTCRKVLDEISNFSQPKYLTTEEAPFILPNSFEPERSNEYKIIFSNYFPKEINSF